jgi:ankyrin repeat protein
MDQRDRRTQFALPKDLYPVVALFVDKREDVFSLSLSSRCACEGLTETDEPLVKWIVRRCMEVRNPLKLAVNGGHASRCLEGASASCDAVLPARRPALVVAVLRALLPQLLPRWRAERALPVSADSFELAHSASGEHDAVQALCMACRMGLEGAVDALLDGETPLPPPGTVSASAVHGSVMDQRRLGPPPSSWRSTRMEAAYFALRAAIRVGVGPSRARIVARLLDWAPEVEPEHVLRTSSAWMDRPPRPTRTDLWSWGVHSLVHQACAARNVLVLREILERRWAPEALLDPAAGAPEILERHHTPLSLACNLPNEDAGSRAVVAALLERRARHSPRIAACDNQTPLHMAAARGSAGVVRMLLAAGAHADAADVLGLRPLHMACGRAGRAGARVVRALLDGGADPNGGADSIPPLLRAAQLGADEVVELLLQANADPNAHDTNPIIRNTPLHVVCTKGAVESLVAAGARVDARRADGMTPLGTAVQFQLRLRSTISTSTEVIQALVKAGADPLARDHDGMSELAHTCASHTAGEDVRISIIKLLAASPALSTARLADTLDAQGRTPLDVARAAGRYAVADALLKEPWARLWHGP